MALRSRPTIAAAFLLVVAACGRADDRSAPAASSAAATAGTPAAPAKPACERSGHWNECQVFTRLEQSGVAPRRDGTASDLPALGIAPKVYAIGKATLAVYLFADTVTRARAGRSLDTLHFISPAASLTMRGEATAIQNDNLLALLYSRNDQQRERVSDAFMAGAPR